MRTSVCAALFLSAAGLVYAQNSRAQAATKPVTVDIKNVQGQSVATATLTAAAKGVKITVDIKNLPPGEHSFHIHQVAKCEPPDFKSAGPHFGGGGHMHEGMNRGTPAGDIPDFALIVAADGTAHASTIAPNVTLGADANSVFSNGGTAIVIHAVAGGSGAPPRIACGVITKPE
jgi:Cu-Zn family superoxide dismutase